MDVKLKEQWLGKDVPITALIVCYNEADLLKDCIESVNFCNEVVVVDLGSTDSSIEVAKSMGAKVFYEERTLIAEFVRIKILNQLKYEWVLFIDPDERIDITLKEQIVKKMPSLEESIAAISVPWKFYFKRKPLKGTFWGNPENYKTILVDKRKIELPSNVNQGYKLKNSMYKFYYVEKEQNNYLHHFWMNSYKQLFEKHLRYLKLEGKAYYERGVRYTFYKHIKSIFTSFLDSFIIYKGYKDGFAGFFLSLFYSWYVFNKWRALKRYESFFKETAIQ